jgi:hypothetical protein
MIGVPERTEAAPYYFTYINRVTNPDVVGELESQLGETLDFLRGISEEKSLHRYAPDKWSIREVVNRVNDAERVFAFRVLWFGRGFETPLPSFDQDISSRAAKAGHYSWASYVKEFAAVREATLALFRNLPAETWERKGTASGNLFTVRALAFVIAGHVKHHRSIVETRYL